MSIMITKRAKYVAYFAAHATPLLDFFKTSQKFVMLRLLTYEHIWWPKCPMKSSLSNSMN